ncbi:MAG: hypothetical protein A2233_02170 [Candidatus Kerfeldbacteria bacterium RIFOXYA2_FULL_38_24]|uniref:Peptidase M50 domain-containing protein n=1 Tax=Candidatus Kerfeldbacteria bacterium RIFOXYB2_FULL_38_14 TaxID=1798547 RepID=A0A1G2BGR8_9BACT|nr:MAG: hypothetical protein A2319_04770 [Candidatus Kerfeldbacteria bacterium RIFOXYB2_FULL_38_14]OGY87919.1 MAG: hypothetical protein A2233_02170 [Candidatus Kerfeldbacteria bacterium RIFOXYA2_FULL_38_24]OGY88667.1 MAG: hypothetical protein A2458_03430 [Candidatus Kerfeldbacteria bacterium RIFOXYC2_FULL_38_9]
MLINNFLDNPLNFLLWILAIVLGLTIHEFSHALAGKLQGDHTAEIEGRLSLNPLAHIDWLGFALLVVAGFGWAKPTPFNPYNLKYKKYGSLLVALAGPVSNVIFVVFIGLILHFLYQINGQINIQNLMVMFFINLIQVNILLAVFNLIPIPPLDGSKILYTFIAQKYQEVIFALERYGTWLLLALVFFGGSFISKIFYFFYKITINLIF